MWGEISIEYLVAIFKKNEYQNCSSVGDQLVCEE